MTTIKWLKKRLKKLLKLLLPAPYDTNEQVVRLRTGQPRRGRALLAYINEPFLVNVSRISLDHTQHWESWTLGQVLLAMGYDVDVISYRSRTFRPEPRYDIFIGTRGNFDRLYQTVGTTCKKIVHLDTAHWIDNNTASFARYLQVKQSRATVLKTNTIRQVEANWSIENADCGTVLGNGFTLGTYAYAGKPLYRLAISTPDVDAEPATKDFNAVKKNYLWFGSAGFVHKGLDIVLEVFRELPDYKLYVCGPVAQEKSFAKAFHRELYETPNIITEGWVNVTGERFQEIARDVVGLVYPSCAEGGGASALMCMRLGIIPLLSYEASVDVDVSYGVLFEDISHASVRAAVVAHSALPIDQLRTMAEAARGFVLTHHTRAHFRADVEKVLAGVLGIND